MSSILESVRMDKSFLHVSDLNEEAPDRDYLLRKTPDERMAAMEYLRVLNYGESATPPDFDEF